MCPVLSSVRLSRATPRLRYPTARAARAHCIRHAVAQRRHRALRRFLDRGQRRGRRAGARAHAEQHARLHLEDPAADHDADQMRQEDGEQRRPPPGSRRSCQPTTKSGPAFRPTTATKPARPMDSNIQSVGPGMRPKKRGHMDRSQPQTRPPSRTPTLNSSRSRASQPQRRNADQAPATMPNATRTMSVASVARSGTPSRPPPASRRVGPDERDTSPRCTACREGSRPACRRAAAGADRRCERPLRPRAPRSRARRLALRHDHIQGFGRDVEQILVVDFAQAERLLVDPGHQQFPAAGDRPACHPATSSCRPDRKSDRRAGFARRTARSRLDALFDFPRSRPTSGDPGCTS